MLPRGLLAYLLGAHLLWAALLWRQLKPAGRLVSLYSTLCLRRPLAQAPALKVPARLLLTLTENALCDAGCTTTTARVVAATLVASQRDGRVAHGLGRLPAMVASVRKKSVKGDASPILTLPARGQVRVDADGGFVHRALEVGIPMLAERAHELGVATLSIVNARGIVGALWHHAETLAEDHGLISVCGPADASICDTQLS